MAVNADIRILMFVFTAGSLYCFTNFVIAIPLSVFAFIMYTPLDIVPSFMVVLITAL